MVSLLSWVPLGRLLWGLLPGLLLLLLLMVLLRIAVRDLHWVSFQDNLE